MVALHPEGVDRNSAIMSRKTTGIVVALHPEGVDRNHRLPKVARVVLVALHPEGVDRNGPGLGDIINAFMSPSTRRAWIEITEKSGMPVIPSLSPSTRRAWVESKS